MDRGDDALGRFVTAIETSPQFRTEIASGDLTRITFALELAVNLPPPHDGALVTACKAIFDNNSWGALDNLRKALTQTTGPSGVN